jgi:tRNA pseudouridine38-40 synthase
VHEPTRYALALEYDGATFCGFQSQPTGCSVQDALERALREIADAPVRVVAAGRTDAGVHATCQIVHFDTPAERPLTAWVRGVNAHLPAAASALWCAPVTMAFHARFRASARHYSYVLLDRAQRPGLLHGRVGWHHATLDVDAMRDASRCLVGTHDFSSFRASECQAKSPVKTLAALDIARVGAFVRFDFAADAFLHHMVRNIVGALVDVGTAKRPPASMIELLEVADRTGGPPTFAADGLYFRGALYDAAFALPPTVRDLPALVA